MAPVDLRSPTLPAALARVLEAIPAGAERARLAPIFQAATEAIRALGELDLARWEADDLGVADLSVWEALAPVVHDTFLAVQAFVDVVGATTAADARPPGSNGARADRAARPGPAGRPAAAEAVIRDIGATLSRELKAFGEGLRRPHVAADRWRLLAYLGEFRGKFRLGIGELVFLAARLHAPVTKAEVVPFYRQEVDDAVLLRRAFVRIGLAVHADVERARAGGDAAREAAGRVLSQLDVFLASKPWRLVRADDKRALLEARRALAALAAAPAPSAARLVETLDGLDQFFASLLLVNRRETLIGHDREAFAAAARRLADATAAVDAGESARARDHLAVALSTAQRLLGRDRALDALLLSLRRVDPAALDDTACRRLAGTLAAAVHKAERF